MLLSGVLVRHLFDFPNSWSTIAVFEGSPSQLELRQKTFIFPVKVYHSGISCQ